MHQCEEAVEQVVEVLGLRNRDLVSFEVANVECIADIRKCARLGFQ